MSQGQFVAALLNPEIPVPDGLLAPDGRPALRRFNVYRNNVIASLVEALADGFPVVRKLTGDEFFRAVARQYVQNNIPNSPLMFRYGDRFPGFLADHPSATGIPYLADVARLEWARREVYHAADSNPCSGNPFAKIPAEKLGSISVRLLPAVRIVESSYPILGIWKANTEKEPVAITARSDDVLVSRPEMLIEMRTLPAGAARFLRCLASGDALGVAATHAGTIGGFDLARSVTVLLEARIIKQIRLDGEI